MPSTGRCVIFCVFCWLLALSVLVVPGWAERRQPRVACASFVCSNWRVLLEGVCPPSAKNVRARTLLYIFVCVWRRLLTGCCFMLSMVAAGRAGTADLP